MTDSSKQYSIDSICDEFESHWASDRRPQLEEFLDRVPAALRAELLTELLQVELWRRHQESSGPDQDHYKNRFPDLVDAVDAGFRAFHSKSEATIDGVAEIDVQHPPADPLLTVDPLETFDPELTTDPLGANTPTEGEGPTKAVAGTGGQRGSSTIRSGNGGTGKAAPKHANDPNTRYRPTEMHARGGLGAVFRARDQELNRVVALKEILPEHSDKLRYQEKFIFEAEVTGALEHPGIVPVYGLGRYSDEQPYYAMRFIHGRSFRELIREFHKRHQPPTSASFFSREFRSLLRRLIETCNAIHFAHEHGVIHRDIKPANVMLGDYGETLVVDWGLAKLFDPQHASVEEYDQPTKIDVQGSGSSKTVHGTVVGTPMYMSPEQAYGKIDHLDGRTDIYSLGAVLFHLVTGENPIDGRTSVDIIVNVRQGKTRSVRDVTKSAPAALASICHKSMAMDPSQRYTTAIALADDIDRWLNDEAVLAHVPHENVLDRAGRLIRRYRSWTISGAMALLMITAISVVAGLLVNQARKQEQLAKEQERLAKVDAVEFKQDAVERYRESRNAIDTWLVQSTDALEFFPGTSAVRKRLLERAVEDYERLAQRESRDPQLTLERGRAIVRVGDLTLMQQDFQAAEKHYAAAMQIFRDAPDDDNLSVPFQSEHANVRIRIGNAYAEQKKIPEAEQQFQAAIEQLVGLIDPNQDPLSNRLPRRLLATAYVNAGKLFVGLDSERAIEYLTDGLDQYDLLGDAADETTQLGRATARDLLGQVYRDAGDHDQAMVFFDQSADALQQLVDAQPDHPNYLNALASVYVSKAASFRTRGLDAAMFESLSQAIDFYRALRNSLPDLPRYALNLAIAQTALGLAQHEAASNREAELTLTEAFTLLDELVTTYGQSSRILEALASCQDARGQVFLDLHEDPGDALRTAQDILLLLSQSATSDDEVIRLFEQLAIAQSHLAQAYQRLDQTELSRQKFDEAIKRLESLIGIQGEVPRLVNALAHTHYRAGLMLADQNDLDAESQFGIARDLWIGIDGEGTASDADSLAWLLATCPTDSITDPAEARRYAKQAVKLAPENPRYLTTLALAAALEGEADAAIKSLQRCKTLRGHWVDRDLYVLAMAEQLAGNTDKAKQAFDDAETWRMEHQPFEPEILRLRQIVRAGMED
ncbi:serine/threonine-protein kinase [Stieleria neptunia]|nr:serine/threonine-protein kinase [Stieleria neptunia]